jgi:ubiquinone/menaquinone biosynthesis C-methylase UbiE
MLDAANGNPRPEIEYRQAFAEELELPESDFDLVVNPLMFHYIDDLKPVIKKIHSWLHVGGNLVF